MNIRLIFRYISNILRLEGILMLPPLILALARGEAKAAIGFAATIAAVLACSFVTLLFRPKERTFFAKEGFVTVSLSWIILSLFGSLPFYLSGEIPRFIDCVFETVSGFTTTGASILGDVESMSLSLLYWRSFTHWLGGMGILVFLMAIVPLSEDAGSLRVLRAESPGPVFGKFVPKLSYTARILYAIYIALTLAEILLLLAGGMPLFDSIVNAFATAGTGGFAIKNASIGAYGSYYLQGVIAVFMILFGVNFNIYYFILMRDFKSVLKNEELRLYFGVIAFSVLTITINVRSLFGSLYEAFHNSLFQVASIMTTTGFATADFDRWPQLSRMILVLLMILGASAGSTGGGIKMARVLILFKSLHNSIQKMLHSRCIKLVKLDGKTVDHATIREVNVFMSAYLLFCGLSMLVISAENFSFDTTVTSVLACINNIGPGLGTIGPSGNYAAFSDFSKIVLTLDMLIGRLEIFPMLMLFSPSVWKRGQ